MMAGWWLDSAQLLFTGSVDILACVAHDETSKKKGEKL
jgi:hypothetical protein